MSLSLSPILPPKGMSAAAAVLAGTILLSTAIFEMFAVYLTDWQNFQYQAVAVAPAVAPAVVITLVLTLILPNTGLRTSN